MHPISYPEQKIILRSEFCTWPSFINSRFSFVIFPCSICPVVRRCIHGNFNNEVPIQLAPIQYALYDHRSIALGHTSLRRKADWSISDRRHLSKQRTSGTQRKKEFRLCYYILTKSARPSSLLEWSSRRLKMVSTCNPYTWQLVKIRTTREPSSGSMWFKS